jgi:hypothetical protein
MLRLTSRNEFIAALVLVIVGAQNLFVAQSFGIEEFPRYISWLLMLTGVYVGTIPFTKAPRDLGASFVMVFIGVTALYFGAELTMGTAGRMGPGYFPRLLAWLIIAIGIFVGSMSLSVEGPPIRPPQLRPIGFVMVSIVVFGYLMSYIGLAVTAVVVVLIAGFARKGFSIKELLVLGAILSIGTVLIFVYALGQALPDCPDGFRCTQYFGWGG